MNLQLAGCRHLQPRAVGVDTQTLQLFSAVNSSWSSALLSLLNLRKLLLPQSSIVNDTRGALIAINRDDGDE